MNNEGNSSAAEVLKGKDENPSARKRIPKPRDPVFYLKTILDPPQNYQPGIPPFYSPLTHVYMDFVPEWAEPKDAVEAFGGHGTVKELTRALYRAVGNSGFMLQEFRNRPLGGMQIDFECSECNPSYDGVGCCNTPMTVPLPMVPFVHYASVLQSATLSLLLWDAPELSDIQKSLLEEMSHKASKNAQQLQQSIEEGRYPILTVLLGQVDNALISAPRLAISAMKLMSILVLQRPAALLEQTDARMLAQILRRVSQYLLNLIWDPCRVKIWFGISHILDLLPLLYFLAAKPKGIGVVEAERDLVPNMIAISDRLLNCSFADKDLDIRFPVEEYGCLRKAFPATTSMHAQQGAATRALLESHPASFAAFCTVELLHWWELCGVPVRSTQVNAYADKEDEKGMAPAGKEAFTLPGYAILEKNLAGWKRLANKNQLLAGVDEMTRQLSDVEAEMNIPLASGSVLRFCMHAPLSPD
uniref:Uncharacterized protein n=1 Tax=Chromera velia CCMP2878 TaxID=1169474 RepID=A0A0G4I381_9ALVE|eukprot:Cvel_1747.t1-p1 / transcript=Cvel_1747.t1 / gene=Cvel_1747 / organism=Chromera_velia_CCMP2878 / gene_product=hypothetical protein / transcript_product=hypothetical protein / location=Cvel_scaffold63:148681-150093(+) / protein_length=471 / sequence_SO=supercontig / SO=protein_coding / is_pseudo=false